VLDPTVVFQSKGVNVQTLQGQFDKVATGSNNGKRFRQEEKPERMNRRKFIANSGAALFLPAALTKPGFTAAGSSSSFPAASSTDQTYAAEMPNMLESYLTRKLIRIAEKWDRKRDLLTTAADVEARNAFVREKLLLMLGGFPERNSLHATTVKVEQKDGYNVENVMFCSRPDFWVTGNLYIPTTGSGRFPAIISPCGHYPLARMIPQYQSAYISLVKSGFVVLAYDPIGQGERREYWNPATNITEVGGPVFEHSMPGQELVLLGQTLTGYFVWDAMRAIDYLLTRAEVDSKKIGCAGHSGGGTMTKFISVADPRVQCAVILEGGTANASYRSIGFGDIEQDLFPAPLYGINNVDLHVAVAPRPLLACIEHYSEGFDRAADAIRGRYKQLGAEDHFATVAADDPHSWSPKLRRATTDWFCRWFYGRSGPSEIEAYETSRPEDLYCTPDGSLRYSNKGMGVFSVIAETGAALPPRRTSPKSKGELAGYQSQIREQLQSLLRLAKTTTDNQPLGVRSVVVTPREGYHIEKIEILSEPGIYVPVWVFVPENKSGILPTILYLNDVGMEVGGMEFAGSEASGLEPGPLDELARRGYLVIAADVRGIGETSASRRMMRSLACGEFGQLFNTDTEMAYGAWWINESLLGMRVWDVLRCVDYVMQRKGADHQHLNVIGKGQAGLWCLYAAALDSRIRNLICVDSLLSYRALTQVDRYLYGADIFVPDILLYLDLPQVAAAVSPRPLTLIEPRNPMKERVSAPAAHAEYRWTGDIYDRTGAGGKFRIECNQAVGITGDRYIRLLEASRSSRFS
jgi:cephalosporin-C deacetylase-like acetyl esterase